MKRAHVSHIRVASKSCRYFRLEKIVSVAAIASFVAIIAIITFHSDEDFRSVRYLQARNQGFPDALRGFSTLEREIGAVSLRHAPLASFISVGTEDWMSLLDDDTLLSKISIPGTHDSAAYIGRPLCDTQNWSLSDQLRSGIRYLDIRCRPVDNYFNIHHGVCFLHQRFDDVLKVIRDFLRAHTGETIIMRISNEFRPSHDALDFERIWNRYMQHPTYGNIFVPNLDDIPTLGDVRGRIIVVSNELGPRPDYGFQFFGGPFSNIQDVFKLTSDEAVAQKVELIFSQLETAPLESGKLTFNHLSGTGLPDLRFLPKAVADNTNTATYNLIGFGNFKREAGIIIADYPGEGLISRILLTNFGEESQNQLRTRKQFQLFSATLCKEGKQIGFLDYPYRGGSITVSVSASADLKDNMARSIFLPGPVDPGTRIFVGGLSDLLGKSDSTIITIIEYIPEGESICIRNLRDSITESGFVQSFQEFAARRTDLPSSFFVERPTNETASFSLEMTRDLQWTDRFCVGKSSDSFQGGPIIGILRSKVKGCQTLVQSKTKLCAGKASYWTSFISLPRETNQCREGYYVGQIKCFGAKCSRMMLRCVKTSDQCSLDASGASSVRKIRYGEEAFCPFGSVLTGVDCQRPTCVVFTAFCTKLTYNGE